MRPFFTAILILGGLVFGGFAARAGESEAGPAVSSSVADHLAGMSGESLFFDIGFLWMNKIAEGSLEFSATDRPGMFRAVLEGRTRGLLAWLTKDRVQRYESLMEIAPDGGLRTLLHEGHIIRGRGGNRVDHMKRFRFDHARREVVRENFSGETLVEQAVIPIEGEAFPNDILTVLYNFRAGNFGNDAAGEVLEAPTITDKGESLVRIKILSPGERRDNPFLGADGLLAEVRVAREVFEIGGGTIFVWFDSRRRPRWGVLENALGYGDLRGTARP